MEFALVVGLFVFILYGLVAFGMVLATKQRVTNAAAEGARAAVGSANAPDAVNAATARVLAAGLPVGAYTPVYTTAPCGTTGNECITVSITWTYKDHPVVTTAPGLGLVMPESFGSTATVQFK